MRSFACPVASKSAQGRTGVQFVPLPLLLRDLLNSFSLGVSVDVGDWYVWLADLLFLALSIVGLVRLCIKGGRGDRGCLPGCWGLPGRAGCAHLPLLLRSTRVHGQPTPDAGYASLLPPAGCRPDLAAWAPRAGVLGRMAARDRRGGLLDRQLLWTRV